MQLLKIKDILKRSITIRSFYIIWKKYFGIRRSKFGYCDKTAIICPPIFIGNPKNVYLYENTNIYMNSEISAIRAKFIMKKNSGAAEGLMVRTGNHKSVIGKWFKEIGDDQKESDYDKDVVVEEDVWIGCNVTLLSGVIVGRGAVVGAGSVVRNTIPPYSVVIGNPAKIVGFRFTPEEIIEHEKALYREDERLPLDLLNKNYEKFFINRIKEIKQITKL